MKFSVGPDIRKLMFDKDFPFTMTEVERETRMYLKVLPSTWRTIRTLTTLLLLQIC
jgi:hypothetical protein